MVRRGDHLVGVGILKDGELHLTREVTVQGGFLPRLNHAKPNPRDCAYHRKRIENIARQEAMRLGRPLKVFATARYKEPTLVGEYDGGKS